MVLAIGEILVDIIKGPDTLEMMAGGAPFNLAYGIQKLGGDSFFVGSIGEDQEGEFLLDFVLKNKIKANLSKLPGKVTTSAIINIDEQKERTFFFIRENGADSQLSEISDDLFLKANIIHLGSLMLSEEIGFVYANKIIDKAKALGKLISFDVNYRSDIFKNQELALARYQAILKEVDIIKFSSSEVRLFKDDFLMNLEDKLILVTKGSEGSTWYYQGQSQNIPSISVRPVDMTGAGDAFFAGVLKELDGQSKRDWTEEFLNRTLRIANICGALNTLSKGATAGLPTLEKVKIRLKELERENDAR